MRHDCRKGFFFVMKWSERKKRDTVPSDEHVWGKCDWCGTECWISTDKRNVNACSLKCSKRLRGIGMSNCELCGKPYHRHGKQRFCSVECHKKSQHWSYQPGAQQFIDSVLVLSDGGVTFKAMRKILNASGYQIKEAYIAGGRDYDEAVRISQGRKTEEEKEAEESAKEQRIRPLLARAAMEARRGGSFGAKFLELCDGEYSSYSAATLLWKKYAKGPCPKSVKHRKRTRYTRSAERQRIKSTQYAAEEDFADALAQKLKAEREVFCGKKSARRCDCVAEVDGVTYAIECKITTRTNKCDEALGQALVSARLLGLSPCVAFPEDCHIDGDFMDVCRSLGVRVIHGGGVVSRSIAEKQDDSVAWWGTRQLKDWWKENKKRNPSVREMIDVGFTDLQIASIKSTSIKDVAENRIGISPRGPLAEKITNAG